MQQYDVVVVGGSFAGQSAAMQLARARRSVLLIDHRRPRNRYAPRSHGFLGQDGQAPMAILDEARRQLACYPTVEQLEGEAISAVAVNGGFTISLADGRKALASRMVLAIGVHDSLPEFPGIAARWGRSVLHCPYCHGYEYAQSSLGVLAVGPMSVHQAMLVSDWGATTYFTQGRFAPTEEECEALTRLGVRIETRPVVALCGPPPELEAVRLSDGTSVPLAALFLAPRTRPATGLAEQLGCALEDGPTGSFIRVDAQNLTSVAGVYAAGDAAMPMANATLASASGVIAGTSAHRSLVLSSAH